MGSLKRCGRRKAEPGHLCGARAITRNTPQRSEKSHSRFLLMIFVDRELQRLDDEAAISASLATYARPAGSSRLHEAVQRSHRDGILVFLVGEQRKDEQSVVRRLSRRHRTPVEDRQNE